MKRSLNDHIIARPPRVPLPGVCVCARGVVEEITNHAKKITKQKTDTFQITLLFGISPPISSQFDSGCGEEKEEEA